MYSFQQLEFSYVLNIVHEFESDILSKSANSTEFTKLLGKWLPVTGNWSVCWRVTRDGNDSQTFHTRCDSKSPTLTVVKVLKNNTSLVFGGFTTAKWAVAEGFAGNASGSFLFSFRNNDGLPPFKSPVINNGNSAILRFTNSGPKFGVGPDLAIADASIYQSNEKVVSVANLGHSYQAPSGYNKNEFKTQSLLAGSLYFTPAEVEVLYLN